LDHKTTTMRTFILLTPLFFSLSSHSQNLIQLNSNFGNQALSNNIVQLQQVKNIQVFASNQMMNTNANVTNKVVRINAHPRAVQRTRSSNANPQRQIRRRASRPVNTINVPAIQTSQAQINPVQAVINNDIQLQAPVSQMDNNAGNASGNEFNPIEQIAQLNIPAIQLGNADMDINLPKINLKPIKFSSGSSSNSKNSNHTLLDLKKKFAKFNRKTSGKLSFKKKLRIKVDKCFKW